jgi:uncharacterized membrane protein required for colicin V production
MNVLAIVIIAVLSAYRGFVVHAMLLSSTLADAQRLTAVYAALVERFVTAYECDKSHHVPTLTTIAAYNTAKRVLREMRVTA